jgi:hypothetical protein
VDSAELATSAGGGVGEMIGGGTGGAGTGAGAGAGAGAAGRTRGGGLATGADDRAGREAGIARGAVAEAEAAVRIVRVTAPTNCGSPGRSSVTVPVATSSCFTFPSRNQYR